ncbi:lipoate-protein ligase B, partial [Methylobacterium bullatum]|nr:lipoate-protein ligase B [Methylobacterium bullatum]
MRPVLWRISDTLVPYDEAVAAMEAHAGRISSGEGAGLGWLLEHPPPYNPGTPA